MADPEFSIIVPVYNAEKYLTGCLDSILAQDFKDFELILIDDGSEDGSGTICDNYSKQDDRIRVFHIPNNGVSHARNIGLENSRGHYITFMDSDDAIENNALSIYHDTFLYDETIDAIKAGYISEVKGVSDDVVSLGRDEIFSDKSDLFKILEDSGYYSFVWNFCIRKECIRGIRFNEDINWLEDHIFCYECYFNCRKIAVISSPLYHYITHVSVVTNLSHVHDPRVIYEAMELEYEWKTRLNGGKYPEMDKSIQSHYRHNVHRLINVLYTRNHSYATKSSFANKRFRKSEAVYRVDKIFSNSKIPFALRNIALNIIYLLRRIRKS